MKACLEIEELRDGLLIRSVRRGSVPLALLAAAIIGAVVFLAGQIYFHRPALVVITVLAAIWGSSRWWRAVRAELRITETGMHATAHTRRGRWMSREIRLVSVRNLEYRAPETAGKQELPGGLYVQQQWEANCVLPDLDEYQAQNAIDAIHRRFPTIPVLPSGAGREATGRSAPPLNISSAEKANSSAHS
jgi:hypothetical protein